tara:strand:- start:127 stop:990 length:864 start_codon:yes stop_codon:yes gene_type:complete
MFKFKTSQKIYIASILSKFLIFFLGKKKRIITRNKILYLVDLNEGIDLGIFLNIKNEKKLFNIQKVLKNDKNVNLIDVGSNVGSVALPLAKLFNKSNIIAIEPTIYAFKKLKKNISLNYNLKKKIRILNLFISNKYKKVKYVHSSWNFSDEQKKHKIHLGSLRKNTYQITSLDRLVKKLNKKIHFIKIDVDGYELDVLNSGYKIIKKYKPIIHIEFAPYLHKDFGYTTENLIKFIKKKINYSFFNEDFIEIKNIESYAKTINNRSENFFLINKNNKNVYKKLLGNIK